MMPRTVFAGLGRVAAAHKLGMPSVPVALVEGLSEAELKANVMTDYRSAEQAGRDKGLHYVCMAWRHIEEIVQAGGAVYTELENLIVWKKSNGGMGALYRSKHELVFAFKNGSSTHINNFGLGQHGR